MDLDRSDLLAGALLLAGLALIATPVLAPPDVPADRVEYYVEGDWSDIEGQENLAYTNLSAPDQAVFDTALSQRPDTVNRSVSAAPTSLRPEPDSIDVYNVRYDGSYYLLQVRYLTYEADFVTQHLPRLGAFAFGSLLVAGAAYSRYGR